ncbi:ArsR family transcriptional regulator [Halolamina salifodinae]
MKEVIGEADRDGPPPGEEAWKAQTKGVERVIDVATVLDQPRTAEWIADEAAVAEQTARDHLGMLSELGVVTQTTARGVTKYQRDPAFIRFREISIYVERYERDDLMDVVAEKKKRIKSTKEEYEIETPDELRSKAVEDATSSEEVVEYKKAAAEFETLQHELGVIKEALERYDEFTREGVTA